MLDEGHGIVLFGQMTLEKCKGLCINHRYLGLQNSYECFCGDSLGGSDVYQKTNESECNYACQGDSSQKCGGFWRSSVYEFISTVPSTTKMTTPEQSTVKITEMTTHEQSTVKITEMATPEQSTVKITEKATPEQSAKKTTEMATPEQSTVKITEMATPGQSTVQTTEMTTTEQSTVKTTEMTTPEQSTVKIQR
ncbi:unnamed protein product [Mytilus edulis]|uniref:WSC domain-containing protein n=1 Tax=Mytilus edulis TaxID=6550 RepID=A0A8S3R988_MYTED|nr:unnamed protein product [Mytilus edulis]